MMKTALIFGVNGGIGRALSAHLRALGVNILGTMRPGGILPGVLSLALTDTDSLGSCPLPDADVAFFCAGITRLADCAANPDHSRLVNVEAPVLLCRRMVERGTRFVYLSSSSVFDGTRPHVPADAPYSPRTEYGRQKAAAEETLLRMGGHVSIVRLTKVLGPGSIITSWINTLNAGETIRPFSNLTLAPVALGKTAALLAEIGLHGSDGIWQMSGAEDVSYAEAAHALAGEMGMRHSLVLPWTVEASGTQLEDAPPYTSLDTRRLNELAEEREYPQEWFAPELLQAILRNALREHGLRHSTALDAPSPSSGGH